MTTNLERRAAEIGAEGEKIRGMAIVFGVLSEDLGGFREIIEPSAVDRTFAEQLDVRALVNHDASQVIGRVKAGTLKLDKRRDGLHVEIDPPRTTAGRDILESVRRGDVTGMSFSFGVVQPHGERFERRNGTAVRIVSDMRIAEISVVTFPAYQATDATVAQRALQVYRKRRRVEWLRMSLASGGFR